MKKALVKFIYNIYVHFGQVLKKLIPRSIRWKIKMSINNTIHNQYINESGIKDTSMPSGINLVGYLRAEMGLGESARLIAKGIETAHIPWCGINSEKLNAVRYTDDTWVHKIVDDPVYNVSLFCINPDNFYLTSMYLSKKIWEVPYNIGYVLWELTDIPKDWGEGIKNFQELWAPSQFIVDALKKMTDKPIYKVPYGISVLNYDKYDRDHFGLSKNIFYFLVMYDFNSTAKRKNPEGAIKAFKTAFNKDNEDVGMIIKINNSSGQAKEEISQLKKEMEGYKNIVFIEAILSRDEVNSLIYCSDVLVSLHRAEGFGLVIAEAMYLGKPAIATNWSSNVEFMTKDNSCLVNYSIVEIEKDFGPYKKGYSWAEPDCRDAADYMLRLHNDKLYYDELSVKGSEHIKQYYNFERCADLIKSRLYGQ